MQSLENEIRLPVIIGRNSSGECYSIDLSILPNLFISYHEEIQLINMFSHLIHNLMNQKIQIDLAVSLGTRMSETLLPFIGAKEIHTKFLHLENEEHKTNTIDEFISSLLIEHKKRRNTKKYKLHSNLSHSFLIVFIDDIFDVIKSTHKKTGLGFIELLVKGPKEAIHFICGSSGIYKNLLDQLINVSLALNRKLQKSKQIKTITEPLAAELIINPDDLIFFKNRDEKDFVRLFPN